MLTEFSFSTHSFIVVVETAPCCWLEPGAYVPGTNLLTAHL